MFDTSMVRLVAMVLLATVVAAGCSDDSAGPLVKATPTAAVGPSAADETQPERAGTGSVDGPLVSVLSFDFGLWTLDSASGEGTELTVAGADYSDRGEPAVLSNDAATAYVVVYTDIQDQDFTKGVALGAIDLATGVGTKLAEFGQNRENDEASELTETRVVGAGSTLVWVEQSIFGSRGTTLIGIDRVTGAEAARVAADPDSDARDALMLGDDLYARVGGVLSRVDGVGWDPVMDFGELALSSFLTPDDIVGYAVTDSGVPMSAEWVEAFLGFSSGNASPTGAGMVAGDGSLWWVWSSISSRDDVTAILGGVVRFDPTSSTVSGSWPLGSSVGSFGDDNTVSTLSDGSFAWLDGRLWFADAREGGKVYRVDPEAGVEAFEIPVPIGIDFTKIELIATDADALWLEVEAWVIKTEDENGRTSSATTTLQRFDPETGTSVLVVDESDLTGF